MSLVLAGRIVPLSRDRSVAPSESASFRGRLWIADDGTIVATTKGQRRGPPGFDSARVVDVGTSLIVPGLIDLHSHLAYATLPLWVEAGRPQPFAHHDIWPSRPGYPEAVTWPAYAFVVAAPAELLAYAEVRALIGGTTSIQGSPPSNRPLDGWLVRNVEDESLGGVLKSTRVLSSTLTLKAQDLGSRAGSMARGSTFIYHCAEGRRGSVVAREFEAVRTAGCLRPQLVAIHTNALQPDAYGAWREPGAVVWSPFSNLWLYGETTDVPAVRSRRITLCLGSDWGPSGTRNVLGELKVARLVSDDAGWGLTDLELVKMVTANPGDVLTAAWGTKVGRLEPGALADVAVVAARARADPFATLVAATERDVELVLVGGKALYGTRALMQRAGATSASDLVVQGEPRALALTRFDAARQPWSFAQVLDRMEQVRQNPKREIEAARARAYAGAVRGDPPPFRLALDMPTGRVPVGGLPKDLGRIVVPEVQPLAHDAAFFAQVTGRGFHGGRLDRLADYYA
jgi:cytosine/adenosine deaminase-related metal-dependent hydrolase